MTGYDCPDLFAMYVDRPLTQESVVQTLSRSRSLPISLFLSLSSLFISFLSLSQSLSRLSQTQSVGGGEEGGVCRRFRQQNEEGEERLRAAGGKGVFCSGDPGEEQDLKKERKCNVTSPVDVTHPTLRDIGILSDIPISRKGDVTCKLSPLTFSSAGCGPSAPSGRGGVPSR